MIRRTKFVFIACGFLAGILFALQNETANKIDEVEKPIAVRRPMKEPEFLLNSGSEGNSFTKRKKKSEFIPLTYSKSLGKDDLVVEGWPPEKNRSLHAYIRDDVFKVRPWKIEQDVRNRFSLKEIMNSQIYAFSSQRLSSLPSAVDQGQLRLDLKYDYLLH